MFFEVNDAYIHIDLKTVQTDNIGDYNTSIFVRENQNSYNGNIEVRGGVRQDYEPAFPYYYNE